MKHISTRTSLKDLFLYPDHESNLTCNPPYFSWPLQKNELLTFELKNDKNKVIKTEKTNSNLIELNKPLKPGRYIWTIASATKSKASFSFVVPQNCFKSKPIQADEIFKNISNQHPKHFWDAKTRMQILKENGSNLKLLKQNLKLAIRDGAPTKPTFHHIQDSKKMVEEMVVYFKSFRKLCDRNLISASFAWYLWKDTRARTVVRKFFQEVCEWNTEGVCAVDGPWGDEIGLSLARCLAISFDLTYDIWNQKEQLWIKKTLHLFAKQIYRRLLETNFMQQPGNSHVGRLPAYLGDYAIILKGFVPDDEIKTWLSFSLKAFNTFYPFYGQDDGAWSQGAFYASTYLKWHSPFFLTVEKITSKSLLEKPFYQNYTHFLVHFLNPKHEIHPFGDGYWSYDIKQEWPGFFAENPMKIYQEKFGNKQSQLIANLISKRKFIELHLFDEMVPKISLVKSKNKISKINNDHCFQKTGLISMHSDVLNVEKDNAVYIRCSKYGAGSHQHADQGNFAILSKGQALISPSGFFGAHYGDMHHQNWTQTTQAHNVFLINNVGQPFNNENTTGIIESFNVYKTHTTTILNLSAAYPNAISARRKIIFIKPHYVLLVDTIKLKNKLPIQWLLHSLAKPTITNNDISINRKNVYIQGQFIKNQPENCFLTNQFNWKNPLDKKIDDQKRTQYHCKWTFKESIEQNISMLFSINQKPATYTLNTNSIHFKKQNINIESLFE